MKKIIRITSVLFLFGITGFQNSLSESLSKNYTAPEVVKKIKELVSNNNKKFEKYSKSLEEYKKAIAAVQEQGKILQRVKIEIMANKLLMDELISLLDRQHPEDFASKRDANESLNEHMYPNYQSALRYNYAKDFKTMCVSMHPVQGYFYDPSSSHVRNFFNLPEEALEKLNEKDH